MVRKNPDGTIGLTVGGTRHTLRQVTLGDLRALRDLYNECRAEVDDHSRFDTAPAIGDLKAKISDATDRETANRLRDELKAITDSQDRFVQGQWARWWRECLALLSNKTLPDPDPDDPAVGLEVWMVDTPSGIAPLFAHWRSVPLEGQEGDGMVAALQMIAQGGSTT